MSLSPPCFTEEDRFSLEALQTIHKQMDDDKDGGIEVDESDEVGGTLCPGFFFNRMTVIVILKFSFILHMIQYLSISLASISLAFLFSILCLFLFW
jgi:hypothetical protein